VQPVELAFGRRRAVVELLWQADWMHATKRKLLTLIACLCAGAALVAGCATTNGYSTSRPSVRCDDTGTTEERHACR
jgi:hypothetical protein